MKHGQSIDRVLYLHFSYGFLYWYRYQYTGTDHPYFLFLEMSPN
jgi:hypothetical protein